MSGDPGAVIVGDDVSLAALRADILAALIKKYIVRSGCNLIESSWLIPDEFQITTLGGGVRNSFPFCIFFDSIQSSSATFNLSYFKTAQEGYNTIGYTGRLTHYLYLNNTFHVFDHFYALCALNLLPRGTVSKLVLMYSYMI